MAELRLKAYPVSQRQQMKLANKFRAFASADLSERAEKEGARKSEHYGTGHYPTRSAHGTSFICYVAAYGALIDVRSNSSDSGVRVALQIIYNPNNSIVKSCHSVKRTAEIQITNFKVEKVTNVAPVVTFGKKEYIWLNKEECEAGTASTMELVSLVLVAKSVPFDKNNGTTDFALATEMHEQYLQLATEDCTKEELEMLVNVRMSEKDNYNSATPIIRTKEQQMWEEKIRENANEFLNLPTELFESEEYVCECLDIAKDVIKQETMGLKTISDEYVQNVEEQLKSFSEKIENEKNVLKEKEVAQEKTNQNKATILAMLDGKGEGK